MLNLKDFHMVCWEMGRQEGHREFLLLSGSGNVGKTTLVETSRFFHGMKPMTDYFLNPAQPSEKELKIIRLTHPEIHRKIILMINKLKKRGIL